MSPDRYTDAFRRAIEAPAGSRDRNLAAIERRIAGGEVVDEEGEDDDEPRERVALPRRGRWASALFAFKAVSLSVGLGVAGLGVVKVGAMTWSAVAKDERPPAAAPASDAVPLERGAARRSSGPPAVDPPAPAVVPPTPAVASDAAPVDAPRESSALRSRRRAKTPPSDRLREEVDLMTRARAELDAGRHNAVLALVADHEQRFPDGAMLEERRAWRAIATCSLHRANARTELQSFLDRYPRSSLAEKVRRACANRATDPAARSD